MEDIVVLIPGITGSVLARDGKELWSPSGGAILNALRTLGKNLDHLTLGDGDGDDPELDDLEDGITAPRLMPDLHLIPGLWRIDGYGRVARHLVDRLDLTPGETFFEFPYDWRRHNRVHARRLRRESRRWLAAQRDRGASDPKLVLVAHSMGGLVARAFLELEEDGARDSRALITFGTPYAGSLNAIDSLVNGFKKNVGPFKADLTDMLRSFTSIYHLLPVYPSIDPGDGDLVRPAEVDLPGLDQDRAAAARSFHREIRDANEARLAGLDPGEGVQVYPVVGYEQPTYQSARKTATGVELLRTLGGRDPGGDGTVPRPSAVPPELAHQAARSMFSAAAHSSLQNADEVLTHLVGLLTVDWDPGAFKAAAGSISLDLDDLFVAGEPVPLGGRASEPGAELGYLVTDTSTGEVAASGALWREDADGWLRDEIPPLAEGSYRIRLASAQMTAEPVVDLFVVVAET